MAREIIEKKELSNPTARRLLEERLEEEPSLDIQRRTYAYLQKFTKCNSEKAEEITRKLVEEYKLKSEVAVMLVNVLPETVDEARTILTLEDRVFTTDEIKEILKVIGECREEAEQT